MTLTKIQKQIERATQIIYTTNSPTLRRDTQKHLAKLRKIERSMKYAKQEKSKRTST